MPVSDPALTARVPLLTESQAERIALEHYGVVATARRVAGEKDDNFILFGQPAKYVLKVVHPAESPASTDLSSSLLAALQRVPGVPTETIVRTTSGRLDVGVEAPGGLIRRARLTQFMRGRLLRTVRSTPLLRENLGRMLARLGRELTHFAEPAERRELLWDLWQADRVRPLLDDLPDLPDRTWLVECLDRFASDTRPRLAELRQQLVHNDLSADNVFIADDGVTVSGIIDFGDAVVTQLVNDVAVAMTSQLTPNGDPLGPATDLLRGYHAVTPLETKEAELLYELIRVRIATRLIITEWRARVHPENRAYILRNTPLAWAQAAVLPARGRSKVSRRLLRTCDLA